MGLDQPGMAARRGMELRAAVRLDAERGAFVDAESDRPRVAQPRLGDERHEPPEPVALGEMRVGDDMGEPRHVEEAGDQGHRRPGGIGERGRAVDAAAVHRAIGGAAQDREPRAGAAERPSRRTWASSAAATGVSFQ